MQASDGSAPKSRGRRTRFLIGGTLAVLVIAGGTSAGLILMRAHPKPIKPELALTVPAVKGAVNPNAVIGIALKHARVKKLVVTTANGQTVQGSLQATGWKPNQPLAWATEYHMTVAARGGRPARTVVRTAHWVTPPQPLPIGSIGITISPQNGAQVGMGATWVVQFSQAIPANMQQAVLSRFTVTDSQAEPVGWHWWSGTEVDGRPQNFWPLNEQASISINLDGLAINGYRIENSSAQSQFTVVNQHLTKVSATTDEMQVYNGTQLINTFPVSLGRPGFLTISGTLVVLFKAPVVFMNSATIGYPGLYAQNVYWDVAISTDGYYMHDASWDVPDHGHYNVSHGCIEQNPANSVWFYNWSIPGDVVEVTGTTLPATEQNGEGDWNIPWSQFQAA